MPHRASSSLNAHTLRSRMIDAAQIGIGLIDESGKFLDANPAMLSQLGAPSKQALISKTIRDTGSYNNPEFREAVNTILVTGEDRTIDVSVITSWGKSLVARVFITQLEDENGKRFFQILSEELVVEDTDSFRQPRVRALMDASSNEFYIFDATTFRILEANQQACANLGYTHDEIRELYVPDLANGLTTGEVKELIAPLLSGEDASVTVTTTHRRKDGTAYPLDAHMILGMAQGRPAIIGAIQDITEKHVMGAALEQARTFLDAAPDPSLIVDADGCIQFANRQSEGLLGYTPDELKGMHVEYLVPPASRRRHAIFREGYLKSPHTRPMGSDLDLFAHTKSGENIPIEVSLSTISTSDGVLVATSLRDITERVAAATALEQAHEKAEAARKRAERATLTKSRFLASASHDLRQPLQTLTAYLSVLKRTPDPARNAETITKMEDSVASMAGILESLLDLSQLDAGKIKPKLETFGLQGILDRIATNCQMSAEHKNLALSVSRTTDHVFTDPALFERIIENFVTNAIRYTDKGTVSIICQRQTDRIRISVADTGRGILAADLEEIFEEFVQLENPERAPGKGFGIGLSLVQRLSSLLELPVDVQSTLGEGSVFSISVPISDPLEKHHSDEPRPNGAEATQRALRVLFVEDNEAILDAISIVLELSGFTVCGVADGKTAIDHVSSGFRPDVIVSDFRLDHETGLDVVTAVRTILGTNLPAIIMTGDTSAQQIKEASLPACTIMHKPAPPNALENMIRSMTSQ